MPSGSMPIYDYRPIGTGEPSLQTRSSRRARLWAGGTYFRVREPGVHGNRISVEVIEYISQVPGEEGELKGKCIVTNRNLNYDENVSGPVNVDFLELSSKWNELYKILWINNSLRAQKYSISFKIAQAEALQSDLGEFSFSSTFHVPSKLSIKLTTKQPGYEQNSIITIKPRYRVYDLVRKVATLEPAGGQTGNGGMGQPTGPTTVEGWDTDNLRQQINATDPWIEMYERPVPGGFGLIGGDVQDKEQDAPVLSIFGESMLRGGDGLPERPGAEQTGPSRALIHINYGERQDGSMGAVNQVYEWVGDDARNGTWQRY